MIDCVINKFYSGKKSPLFNVEQTKKCYDFHRQIDQYNPTPLHSLKGLAQKLNVANIYVKDESQRFNLNAFKALGGVYALANLIAKHHRIDTQNISLQNIKDNYVGTVTIATATAGNHGTGIAWSCQQMGQDCIVYMPKGTPNSSVKRAESLGAKVIVTAVGYDETVQQACADSAKNGWLLAQDTAWDGYTEFPTLVSQGYCTMALEIVAQLQQHSAPPPTHIFLQAGVGSMAGPILGYFVDVFGVGAFKGIIVEAETANCLFKTFSSASGELVEVATHNSIMKGLSCGVVNPVTFPVMYDNAYAVVTGNDEVTKSAMYALGNPIADDPMVVSGPSGALSLGILNTISSCDEYESVREKLGIDSTSQILIISTEGDTDPELYKSVVSK